MSEEELKKCIIKMIDEIDDISKLSKIFRYVHCLFINSCAGN